MKMKKEDYGISITVDAPPAEVFRSINNVTKWWTENLEGSSQKLNDEFTVRFGDVHFSRQRLVEVVPAKKVVWLVTESKLNFVKDKQEWNNTQISFEIVEKDGRTQVRFTHIGLIPEVECYDGCTSAWRQYIKGSLFKLITEGRGVPEVRDHGISIGS
jgi:hypothetical protein